MNQLITPASIVEVLPEQALPDLHELLRIQRKRVSHFWTILSEMRLRGELPAWVLRSFPSTGEHVEMVAYDSAAREVDHAIQVVLGPDNRVLFSRKVH